MSPILKAGPVSQARYEALHILVRVERDRAFADILLEHALEHARLEARDAALCTELVYGTPAFALPTLEALLARHQVVAVITQPDKPAGRGRAVTPSPVKRRALLAAVPVLQPPRLRDAGWPERLAEYRADVAVVAALGQILPKVVLDVPAHGSINVHA
ncbi:MAG TPA: formyltransferase family protein, partial [Candidatus Eisenbacteria bacterium]|nr:formyltransferase family protein [Candidatus Eisenbacteria bacterium]